MYDYFPDPTLPRSEGYYVEFPGKFFEDGSRPCRLWTRKIEPLGQPEEESVPLVMIHGFGAGGALFALNVKELAKYSKIFIVDLPGFSRSSRNKFSSEVSKCESQFVEALEQWRICQDLGKMNLMGHSFGGYIVTCYAMEHPENVNHLLLADPWGYQPMPPEEELEKRLENFKYPRLAKMFFNVYVRCNPLAMLRTFGRLSLRYSKSVRPDLADNMAALFPNPEDNVTLEYLIHSNMHNPTGENAFHTLMKSFAWAKNPMIGRIEQLCPSIPLTAIYGANSWMRSLTKEQLEEARGGVGQCASHLIEDARHHVYAQQHDFNQVLISACRKSKSTSTQSVE